MITAKALPLISSLDVSHATCAVGIKNSMLISVSVHFTPGITHVHAW